VPSATILIFPKAPVVYMGEIPPGVDRPGVQSVTHRLTVLQASTRHLIQRAA
jgi:hypothetical protein